MDQFEEPWEYKWVGNRCLSCWTSVLVGLPGWGPQCNSSQTREGCWPVLFSVEGLCSWFSSFSWGHITHKLDSVSCHHHPTLTHLSRNPWCSCLGKIQFSRIFWYPCSIQRESCQSELSASISSMSTRERQFNLQNDFKVIRRALQFRTLFNSQHAFLSQCKGEIYSGHFIPSKSWASQFYILTRNKHFIITAQIKLQHTRKPLTWRNCNDKLSILMKLYYKLKIC